ncbi:MAG: M20/M25/M40 family metallo-hydrolase, partial [Thermoleophilia bacterium]|nr:M20/M25/M40 family metallo-hydrolase [Thermoleophilia bacterium]
MEWYGLSPAEHADLEREVLELFTAILRVDTTNPPGNETACALLLKEYLADNGVESELAGELPDRQNLVAVVEGTRPGPTLLYMGHTDVVPADAAEWTVPPFSGTVKDGYVWGCGTMDMKNQVAAEAVAVARLARSGADFAGRLRFAATCDEEDGTHCGVLWLCRNRPDLIRCDYSVNEGMGGLVLPFDGRPVMLLAVGEKAFAQFTVRTRGLGGHGSVPQRERSAVLDLARAVQALGAADPPAIVSPTTARFIDAVVTDRALAALLKDPVTARTAAHELRAADPAVAALVEPLLGATFTPTVLRAGSAVNVIPTWAEARVDCRITPEITPDDLERTVADVLDPLGI